MTLQPLAFRVYMNRPVMIHSTFMKGNILDNGYEAVRVRFVFVDVMENEWPVAHREMFEMTEMEYNKLPCFVYHPEERPIE